MTVFNHPTPLSLCTVLVEKQNPKRGSLQERFAARLIFLIYELMTLMSHSVFFFFLHKPSLLSSAWFFFLFLFYQKLIAYFLEIPFEWTWPFWQDLIFLWNWVFLCVWSYLFDDFIHLQKLSYLQTWMVKGWFFMSSKHWVSFYAYGFCLDLALD